MISSLANPKIKYVRRLQNDRRFRARERQFVVEGTRWLTELRQANVAPRYLFFTESWHDDPHNQQVLAELGGSKALVSEPVLKAVSETETPQGVVAVAPMMLQALSSRPSLLLLLDGVANPGNVGTILRTAAAAGADGVLLGPGCVDAYNPKVIRGSMGALLRLPVHSVTWDSARELVQGLTVWLTSVAGGDDYTTVDWCQPSALIIGSEARGVSEDAKRLSNGLLTIPMVAATESLNAAVATAVILFEAARQRRLATPRF